jgi:hypothetical protein
VTGGVRNRFSDGVRQAVMGATGNGSGLSFLTPGARDLDARWVMCGWFDGRGGGGGITDGVGEGGLFGTFVLLTVNGE